MIPINHGPQGEGILLIVLSLGVIGGLALIGLTTVTKSIIDRAKIDGPLFFPLLGLMTALTAVGFWLLVTLG